MGRVTPIRPELTPVEAGAERARRACYRCRYNVELPGGPLCLLSKEWNGCQGRHFAAQVGMVCERK